MATRTVTGTTVRIAAARAVASVLDGRTLDAALPGLQRPFDARDRALLQEIAYGTVRWWWRIAHHLDRLLHKPADARLRALLACGIYQLGWMRVPSHAAVAASVDAVDGLGLSRARGMVNAVLRNYIRERATLDAGADEDPVARSAHPAWMLDAFTTDWPGRHAHIIEAGNAPAPMTLRVNRRHATRDAYLTRLVEAGIDARAAKYAPDALTLATPCGVDALPGFADGDVSVQDAASQLAVDLLAPSTGMRVLDACAAPGGKACHILERHTDLAALVAVDIDASRLARVRENLARLHLDAELVLGDASAPDAWFDGRLFDRILLDAPCTATGVIRRHPDIRLLRRVDDVAGFAARQHAMLTALWALLAPGGRMVYATCSLLRAENDAVIDMAMETLAGARVELIEVGWGHPTGHGRQVLTGDDGMDGFHYACLVKAGGPGNA